MKTGDSSPEGHNIRVQVDRYKWEMGQGWAKDDRLTLSLTHDFDSRSAGSQIRASH